MFVMDRQCVFGDVEKKLNIVEEISSLLSANVNLLFLVINHLRQSHKGR